MSDNFEMNGTVMSAFAITFLLPVGVGEVLNQPRV